MSPSSSTSARGQVAQQNASASISRPIKQSDSTSSTPLHPAYDSVTSADASASDSAQTGASSFLNNLDWSGNGQGDEMNDGNIWSFDDVDGSGAGSFPFLQQQSEGMAGVQQDTINNLSNLIPTLATGDFSRMMNAQATSDNMSLVGNSAAPSASTSALSTTRQTGSQMPTHVAKNNPFLNKLRSMVDDPKTDDLIRWSDDGETFLVPNHVRFGDEVLPRFFKHNRFSSFVRQLNMYGFHKVPHLQQGALKSEPGQETELWEFRNDNFQRDKPELLLQMQRKKGVRVEDEGKDVASTSKPGDGNVDAGAPITLDAINGALTRAQRGEGNETGMLQLATVWAAIQAIQSTQQGINDNLRHLHDTNNQLWREAAEQRARSKKQEETINKMLRFLAGIFGAQDGNNIGGGERRSGTASSGGRTENQGKDSYIRPYDKNRRRLLIGQGDSSHAGQIEELEVPLEDEEENDSEGDTPQARITEALSNNSSPATESTPRMRSSETPITPNAKGGQTRAKPSQATPLPNITSEATTTPGGGRRVSQQAGAQLLNALASGEAQQWLANLFGQQQQQAGSHTQSPRTRNDNLNSAASGDSSFKLDAQTLAALQGILAAGGGTASGQENRAQGYFEPESVNSNAFNGATAASSAVSPRTRAAATQNQLTRLGPQQQQLQNVTQDTATVQNALNALVQGLRIGTNGNVGQSGVQPPDNGFPSGVAPPLSQPSPASDSAGAPSGEVDMDSLLKEFFHDPSTTDSHTGLGEDYAGQTPSFAFSPAPSGETGAGEAQIQSASTSAQSSPPSTSHGAQSLPTTTKSSRKRKPDDDDDILQSSMPTTRAAAGKARSTRQ